MYVQSIGLDNEKEFILSHWKAEAQMMGACTQ